MPIHTALARIRLTTTVSSLETYLGSCHDPLATGSICPASTSLDRKGDAEWVPYCPLIRQRGT